MPRRLVFPWLALLAVTGAVVQERNYKVGVLYNRDSFKVDFYKQLLGFASSSLNRTSSKLSLVSVSYSRDDVFTVTDALFSLLQEQVIAVISFSSSSFVAVEAEYLSSVNIPLITVMATDPFLRTPHREYLLRMSPSDSFQSKVVYDILKYFKWNDIAILASNDDYGINGMVFLQDEAVKDSNMDLRIVQHVDQNGSKYLMNLTQQLQLIKDSLARIIVLNTVRYTEQILRQAQQMGLMTKSFAWILTDSATSDLRYMVNQGKYETYYEGLIGISPTWQRTQNQAYFELRNAYAQEGGRINDINIIAVAFIDAIRLIQTSMDVNGPIELPEPMNCSKRVPWSSGYKWLDALKAADFDGASGLVSFDDEGMIKRKQYAVLNLHDGEMRDVGGWNNHVLSLRQPEMIFLGHSTILPSSTVNNLVGAHLRFGVIDEPPCATRLPLTQCYNSSAPECWEGYCIDISKKLAEDLNFTFNLVEPADKKFGRYHSELQRYTGLVYELQQRNIDVAGVILNVNTERLGAVDFLDVVMHTYSVSIYEYEEKGFDNPLFFTRPFDNMVWVMFMLLVVFIGMLVTCINAISPLRKYRFGKYGTQSFEGPFPHWSHMFIISCGLVGSKGRSGIPYSPAARFVILGWWFFTTIVLSMYTANLTAFITIDRATSSIQSLESLMSQDTFQWGLTPDTSTESILYSHSKFQPIATNAEHLLEVDDIVRRVHEGHFVFIAESLFIEALFHNDCNTTRFVNEIPTQGGSFAVPKNVPYRPILSKTLLSYAENGYIERLREKWITPGSDICNKDAIGRKKPFKMAVFTGLFIMLLFGVCTSLLILLLEFIVVGYLDWRNSQKQAAALNGRGSPGGARKREQSLTGALLEIARTGVIPLEETPRNRRNRKYERPVSDHFSDES